MFYKQQHIMHSRGAKIYEGYLELEKQKQDKLQWNKMEIGLINLVVFSWTTQAQTKSSQEFYAFGIMKVIHVIRWWWSYKLQYASLKNEQIPKIVKFNI